MGHSKSTKSIANSSHFRPNLSRDDAITGHAEVLKEKNAAQTIDYLCKYVLPLLPNGSAKVPVYYALKYGTQFLINTQEHGTEYASRELIKTIAREQIAPMVASAIWSQVEDRILVSEVNKALAKPAEEALSEALAMIMERGIDAI